MKYENLDILRPDHQIILHSNSKIKSITTELLEQLQIKNGQIIIDVPIQDLVAQINTTKSYTQEFIDSIGKFIENSPKYKKTGLLLLNSHINTSQIKGMYVYVVRVILTETSKIIEFYNVIKLANIFNSIVSENLWSKFSGLIEQNANNFGSQQMFIAYETLKNLFLFAKLTPNNTLTKLQYDFGDLLFYFNPYNKNKIKSTSSGRNAISKCLANSEYAAQPALMKGLKIANDAIIGNYLLTNQFIVL